MWLSIGETVEHWARYYPKKSAVAVGNRVYAYHELWSRAMSVGTAIQRSGRSGRVAIAVQGKFDYLACLIGANRYQRSPVILNIYDSDDALRAHLDDTRPDILVAHQGLIRRIEKMDLAIPLTCMEMPPEEGAVTEPPATIPLGEEWGVLFSSGSTGISKAIIYDHLAMTTELLAWCLELGIRRDTRFYIGRPICYTGGLVIALSVLLVGGTLMMPEDCVDQDFPAIWRHYQDSLSGTNLSFAFFVPNQLREFVRIAEAPIGGPTILVMGAPISADEKLLASSVLKSPVIESWGNTEGLGTITDKEDLFIRPGSIGRPFLTDKLCVMQDEFNVSPVGSNGRLAGLGETMFKEYANQPAATEKVKKQNMVFSDDIGYMDADGYFYVVGRDQESYLVDGNVIFLSELDDILRQLPGVAEGCIVANSNGSTTLFRSSRRSFKRRA